MNIKTSQTPANVLLSSQENAFKDMVFYQEKNVILVIFGHVYYICRWNHSPKTVIVKLMSRKEMWFYSIDKERIKPLNIPR